MYKADIWPRGGARGKLLYYYLLTNFSSGNVDLIGPLEHRSPTGVVEILALDLMDGEMDRTTSGPAENMTQNSPCSPTQLIHTHTHTLKLRHVGYDAVCFISGLCAPTRVH